MQKFKRWIIPALALGFLLVMLGWFLGRRSVEGLRLSTQREAPVRTVTAAEGTEAPRLDLNRATAEELTRLPGIGETLAQRIIDYREANGPFQYAAELLRVPGIGSKTFEALRDLIYVEAQDEDTDH